MNVPQELVERLAKPLLQQGEPVVYLAECCGKLAVSVRRIARCSKCNTTPALYEIQADNQFSVQPAAPAP